MLSELPISNSQRKSSTSQEQIWVSSELNNSAREWLSPSLSRSKETMGLTGITHLREPSHHHQATRLLVCVSTAGSLYSQGQNRHSQVTVGEYFPTYFRRGSENTCYVLDWQVKKNRLPVWICSFQAASTG